MPSNRRMRCVIILQQGNMDTFMNFSRHMITSVVSPYVLCMCPENSVPRSRRGGSWRGRRGVQTSSACKRIGFFLFLFLFLLNKKAERKQKWAVLDLPLPWSSSPKIRSYQTNPSREGGCYFSLLLFFFYISACTQIHMYTQENFPAITKEVSL